MGQLRDRMAEDIILKGYAPATREEYLRMIHNLAAYYRRPPDQLSAEDLRKYLLHVALVKKLAPASIKTHVAAMKFFYTVTVKLPGLVEGLVYPKVGRPALNVPTAPEVGAVLSAVKEPKYRMLLTTAYASGLRLSEACALRPEDIDSQRMVIRVRCGKGGRGRYTVLSPYLLESLRQYYKSYASPRPPYLFPGYRPGSSARHSAVQEALRAALASTGIRKQITPHTLRHAFATHLLDAGTDLRIIQELLGHSSVHTTVRYTHVTTRLIGQVRSPFDTIAKPSADAAGASAPPVTARKSNRSDKPA